MYIPSRVMQRQVYYTYSEFSDRCFAPIYFKWEMKDPLTVSGLVCSIFSLHLFIVRSQKWQLNSSKTMIFSILILEILFLQHS